MKLSIENCARCSENHRDLKLNVFTKPVEESAGEWQWTHWALCPTTNEPILVRIVDSTDENS